MFRRDPKAREQEATPPALAPPAAMPVMTPAIDDVLDTLAFTLRAIGQHAPRSPDAEPAELHDLFDSWARHVLVGAAPPGRTQVGPTRDWPAIRHTVVGHLTAQSSDIDRVLGDLRDVIWAFVSGLSTTLVDDASADVEARAAIVRLQEAAAAGSTSELKQAALETVAELEAIAASRKARQRDQARRLGEHIMRLRDQLDVASREAESDGLTRVANRKALDRELERAQELCTLVDEPACLIMVDVDHFKLVNDTHGHPVGDQLLCRLADTIVRCFPRRTDLVARFGGDEFAVVLRSAGREDGGRLAERLLGHVRESALAPLPDGGHATFSVSIGVAASRALESPADWLRRADEVLYRAKHDGRDRIAVDER